MDTEHIKLSIVVFHGVVGDELTLVALAQNKSSADEVRLAAALLLCTCDSNERKAEG